MYKTWGEIDIVFLIEPIYSPNLWEMQIEECHRRWGNNTYANNYVNSKQ